MTKGKKIYKKVKDFPNHNLSLLASLPPGTEYDNLHLSQCNVLVVQNKHGFTRVYSMGLDVYAEKELRYLFNTK